MSCGVGHRLSSDPAWLWLWHTLSAVAPIQPLAREPPYAEGAAVYRVYFFSFFAKKKKKKKKEEAKIMAVKDYNPLKK